MYRFILSRSAQTNGDHEVHNTTLGCSFLPSAENQIELGTHAHCAAAVAAAKRTWPASRINGCYYCCPACHTT